MKLSKWETQIRINHYEWCKANGRDTSWFETDKRKRNGQAQATSSL